MSNKIAVVTGGSRGLGRSMVLNLVRKGIDSVFTFLSREDEAKKVISEVEGLGAKAYALKLDTGDINSFSDFSAALGDTLKREFHKDRVNFLVNNAGIGINQPFAETTEEQFDRLMNIHFKGVFFLTQKLLPMIEDGGKIINLSSGLARFSLPGYSAYGAMKGAIDVLTRYMAMELGGRKIAVNSIAPGAIETDFGGGAVRDNRQINDFIASQTALGRVGLPDDIGGLVAAMLSDDITWINGQRIEASGGISL